ncbi:hypothetical protein GIB67_019629 [Kingdonia uniflora]|uniref:Uncharacterized protein n=1 Tax=Kingdonia uniflora TaxID=39325 RepID=A0A7J7N0H0_9MAGN|nr:hypothetical protein GIB67_019629 [Kingdonia uniflora]
MFGRWTPQMELKLLRIFLKAEVEKDVHLCTETYLPKPFWVDLAWKFNDSSTRANKTGVQLHSKFRRMKTEHSPYRRGQSPLYKKREYCTLMDILKNNVEPSISQPSSSFTTFSSVNQIPHTLDSPYSIRNRLNILEPMFDEKMTDETMFLSILIHYLPYEDWCEKFM